MSIFLPRTWAEISVDNIIHNYKVIKNRLNDNVKIMAVVKADAYGHGVKFIAPELEKLGADWFAVSNIEEGLQLRSLNITKPILILGYTPPHMAKVLHDNDISQTVFDLNYAKLLSENADNNNVNVKIHIKVDTGMSRLGFIHHSADDMTAQNEIETVYSLSGLYPEGIFTHFASADLDGDSSGVFTKKQFSLFKGLIDSLKSQNITFELSHCCNSAATLNNPEMHLDMVRPGIILYGMEPSGEFRNKADLRPAMALKSVISMVKQIHKGDTVSYGRTFIAENDITVATIPIGYADGYPRCLSNKGYVIVNSRRANIIGRICMDQMVVDVSGIEDVKPEQTVLLFGENGNDIFTVEDYSALAGTINYETVCIIGKRVPRVFYKNGVDIGNLNYVYDNDRP